MSEEMGNDLAYVERPWLEDLIKYGLRYNIEPTLENAIEIMKKAVANGDIDTAFNVFMIILSNAKSPPLFVYPCDITKKPVKCIILERDKYERLVSTAPSGFEPYFVIWVYSAGDQVDITGWHLLYHTSRCEFVAYPAGVNELVNVWNSLQRREPEEEQIESFQ